MDSYELFISLRYLRARRKQVFVSIITFISIAGILLGVAAVSYPNLTLPTQA